MQSPTYPLTIYYDASCPLCVAEMTAIKARDVGGRLVLVDCSTDSMTDDAPACAGIDQRALMKAIHARDANDVWLRGVDVFIAAYSAVGLTIMARLWSNRMLRPLWDALYPWVARHRQLLVRMGGARFITTLIALASQTRGVRACDEACVPAPRSK